MIRRRLISYFPLLLLFFSGCDGAGPSHGGSVPGEQFRKYWYSGKAEVASYELEQARYGEMREGDAVLIFVTEPFSRSKQVKLDHPEDAGKDRVSVMKLNFTKKFLTGIYPYSMMYSVFTPVDRRPDPYSLKLTATIQEWCGHTFLQLNRRSGEFAVSGYSYFESEGDVEKSLDEVLLEDELWTRIRLDPGSLPVGRVDILPGSFYLRLKHRPVEVVSARATTGQLDSSAYSIVPHTRYSLAYPDRSLVIYFEQAFPHRILGWEETYKSGFGASAREMTTRARLKEALHIDYWNQNGEEGRVYRRKLGLE